MTTGICLHQIAVKIVIYLKGVNCRLAEQHTARTAENIYESAVMKWKQIIDDM